MWGLGATPASTETPAPAAASSRAAEAVAVTEALGGTGRHERDDVLRMEALWATGRPAVENGSCATTKKGVSRGVGQDLHEVDGQTELEHRHKRDPGGQEHQQRHRLHLR